jgi:hypothetical protein
MGFHSSWWPEVAGQEFSANAWRLQDRNFWQVARLKGQWREMVFMLKLSHMVQIERIALLKLKISFCVSFILSVYSENTRKVFKHLWRLRGKYLSVYRENGELALFAKHKIISEYAESI